MLRLSYTWHHLLQPGGWKFSLQCTPQWLEFHLLGRKILSHTTSIVILAHHQFAVFICTWSLAFFSLNLCSLCFHITNGNFCSFFTYTSLRPTVTFNSTHSTQPIKQLTIFFTSQFAFQHHFADLAFMTFTLCRINLLLKDPFQFYLDAALIYFSFKYWKSFKVWFQHCFTVVWSRIGLVGVTHCFWWTLEKQQNLVGCRDNWQFSLSILLFLQSLFQRYFTVCTFPTLSMMTAQN